MSVHVISWVFEHSEARLGDRLTLLSLADHAKKDGSGAWPCVATVARETRLSERQVQRCFRALEESGRIRSTGTSAAGTTVWQVRMAPDQESAPSEEEGGDNMSPGGDKSGADRGQDVTQTVPEPSVKDSPIGEGAKPAAPPSPQTPDESDFSLESPPLFEVKSTIDEQVEEVWAYYVEVNDPIQKNLSPQRRTMLKRALREATVEECKLAIDGNRISNWHRERNAHTLGDIFTKGRTGSLRQKLDRLIADAQKAGGTTLRVIDRGLANEHKGTVIKAFTQPENLPLQGFAAEARAWLEANGINVIDGGDEPRFVEA